MSTIVTRSGKGTPLTNTEVDANFTNLNTDKAELSGSTFTGNLSLGDNVKAQFGASNDLQIYSDGTDGYIDNVTGDFYIRDTTGGTLHLQAKSNEEGIVIHDDGGVDIYRNNDIKLSTTSTGINLPSNNSEIVIGSNSSYQGKIKYNDGSGELEFRNTFNSGLRGHVFYVSSTDKKSLLLHGNNDISFYDSSGTSQNFFWDSSTSRLGLGTTVPSNTIHASGSGNQGIRIQSTGGGVPYFQLSTSGVGDQFIYGNIGSSQNIMFAVAGAERLKINADGSSVFSGSVSTTSHYIADTHFRSSDSNATLSAIGGGGIYLRPDGNSNSANQAFIESGTGAATFSGSVTSTGLTVDGNASVAGTTGVVVDTGTITTGKDSASSRTHWQMNNPNGQVAKWDSNGTDLLHYVTDEYKLYTGGYKAFEIDGNGDISFYNTAGTSQDLFWDSSTSRLGLGTTNPSAPLHIKNPNGILVEATGATTYGVYIQSGYAETMGAIGALSQSDGDRDGASINFRDYGRNLTFNTGEGSSNTERLRINTDGSSVFSGSVTSTGLTAVNSTDTQGKFSGWSVIGANSSSGAIELGQDSPYQGIMSYVADASTRFLFDNTYGSTASTFEFRTNTAATAKTHLKIEGSGDISFYNSAGTSQNLFWDSSASSLGIGVTNVGTKLDIATEANKAGLRVTAPNTTNQSFGATIAAGTSASDYALNVNNAAGSSTLFKVKGDGSSVFSGVVSVNNDLVVNTTNNTPAIWVNTTGSGNLQNWNKNGGLIASVSNSGAITSTGLTVTKASGDIATLEGSGTTSNVQANLVFNPVYDVNARIVSARDGSGLFSRIAFETGVDNTGNTIQRLNIGSHGHISFYDSSGASQNFFWDSSTSRLGLGTTVPTEKLHLQSSDVGSGSGEVAIKMTVPASQISAQNEIRSGVTSGTNPYMSFAVRETSAPYSTVEKLRINADGSSVFSGSVTSTGLNLSGHANFNTAYASTGIYLGAYATANLLDDYEEGTWTPVTSSGSWTVNSADYTKVGNMVTCRFKITATATIAANDFTGLPFTPASESAGVCGYQNSEAGEVFSILTQTSNVWNFRVASTQKGLVNGALVSGMFTYQTTA